MGLGEVLLVLSSLNRNFDHTQNVCRVGIIDIEACLVSIKYLKTFDCILNAYTIAFVTKAGRCSGGSGRCSSRR
jgi:hypothetical protein